MYILSLVSLSLLLLGGAHAQQLQGEQPTEYEAKSDGQNSITREEFQAQQQEINSLQRELNYWQNTTINILKKYLIDNGDNECTETEDIALKDRLSLVEDIVNRTQGCDIQLDVKTEISSFDTRFSRIEEKLEKLENEISQLSHPPLGSFLNPAPSCKFIQEGSPSGHYWIQHTATGYANLEYCHMTRRCCNSTGGWMRVAHLNMTDDNQHCPSGFRLITSPKRTCGTPGRGCVSTTFPLNGVKYSRVCGKIIAYQSGWPDGFGPYYHDNRFTIDGPYVDGVSLTHGRGPKKHIWTFVNTASEGNAGVGGCPCSNTEISYSGVVPPFIAQDYFCDTGSEYTPQRNEFYHVDPLWDGSGCGSTSSCCTFNNPPWFCKELPQPTSDDIEMRVCLNESNTDEDIALESIDIYVQ